MFNNLNERGIRLSGQLINLLTIVLGVAAAYFLTIQSLKIELEAKAESAAVDALDKKLVGFEVILKETVVSRKQFFQFSKDIEARLIRIEQYLKDQSRKNIGKP